MVIDDFDIYRPRRGFSATRSETAVGAGFKPAPTGRTHGSTPTKTMQSHPRLVSSLVA